VICNGLHIECTAVQQILRYAGSSERMATGGLGESRLLRPPLDHLKDVEPAHCVASEVVSLMRGPKQRPFLFHRYTGRLDPIINMNF
jgi:hypothetical protein